MALTYGMKWTIYMLMATHPTTANNDGKSQLRADLEAAAGASPDLRPALVNTVNAKIGLAISTADLPKPLPPNFSAKQLRDALGFGDNEYDPTMGPCPNGTTLPDGSTFDHQLGIANAILNLKGPA